MFDLFSDIIQLLTNSPLYFYSTVGAIALIFGSFLNAAIYRIPIMMEREWRQSCNDLCADALTKPVEGLNYGSESVDFSKPFNLFLPRSQCPKCGSMIRAIDNIPILSYLFLRGRCHNCRTTISIQYPLIEAFTFAITLLIAFTHGPTLATIGLILFSWALITLAVIDFRTMLLPDSITLPLLWLGLLFNINQTFSTIESAVLGAVFGYLSLWSIYKLFKLATGKEGMGYGDFKLLAAIGAWGGWEILPAVIILSACTGAVGGTISLLLKGKSLDKAVPYGPWLAAAGFIALLYKAEVLSLSQILLSP